MVDNVDIRNILFHYERFSEQIVAPTNYHSIKQKILLDELKHELTQLNELLESPDSFAESFKERCLIRLESGDESLGFDKMPGSLTNELYWKIAEQVFAPATMSEMLSIIYPQPVTYLSASLDEQIPQEYTVSITQKKAYLRFLMDNAAVVFQINEPQWLNEAPDFSRLQELIIDGTTIFDASSIKRFPLGSLSQLLDAVTPSLRVRLLKQNDSLRQLEHDVVLFHHRMTPFEAMQQLVRGLTLGGERVNGKIYATQTAGDACKQFFTYFLALPESLQCDLKSLQTPEDSLENVFQHIGRGECVETAAGSLKKILEYHKNNPLLHCIPSLTPKALIQLAKKYRADKHGKELDTRHNPELLSLSLFPSKRVEKTLALIQLENIEDLFWVLVNFPIEYYPLLWRAISFENSGQLEEVAYQIKSNILTREQTIALIQAIETVYERFDLGYSFLHWLLLCGQSDIVRSYVERIPLNSRLNALKEQNGSGLNVLHRVAGDWELFSSLLSLCPEKEQLEAINEKDSSGRRIIHRVASNPILLEKYLNLYSKQEQLIDALNEQDREGNTVWHYAAKNSESLGLLFRIYPKDKLLSAIKAKNKNDMSVLHCAVTTPESLSLLLSFYLKEDRLKLIKEKNKDGQNVLQCAAFHPESLAQLLNIYPDDQKFLAIKEKDEHGKNLLHHGVRNSKSMAELLHVCSDAQIVELLKEEDNYGQNVLYCAVYSHTLVNLLKLLPQNQFFKEQLFELIKRINKQKPTVLFRMLFRASSYPEQLEALLGMCEGSQLLELIKEKDTEGYNALHIAVNSLASLTALLRFIPENERMEAIIEKNTDGYSVLWCALKYPESLKVLLSLLSEDQRLEAFKEHSAKGFNVLHYAVGAFPESLPLLLGSISEAKRLKALNERDANGFNALAQTSCHYSKAILLLLGLIPETQRIEVIKEKDAKGNSILHREAGNPLVLTKIFGLLSKGSVLEAINYANKKKASVLHYAAAFPESLKVLLEFCPKKNRLEALNEKNRHGNTVLHCIVSNPESINVLLKFCTPKQCLRMIKEKNKNGLGVLHRAVNYPESLKVLLSACPAQQRLDAIRDKDEQGNSVLHYAMQNSESLIILLSLCPESHRLELLKTKIGAPPKSVLQRIGTMPVVLRDSFIPDYIKIFTLLNTTSFSTVRFFADKTKSLGQKFSSANTLDEAKKVLIDFISNNRSHILSSELLDQLLPKESVHSIALLCEQWGIDETLVNHCALGA